MGRLKPFNLFKKTVKEAKILIKTNKLVRDRVCENMRVNGITKSTQVRYLSGKEYETFLFAKLMEECAEVIGANTKEQTTEELADLLTVIDAVRNHFDISENVLSDAKTQKHNEKGGFIDGCLLEGIEYQD